MDLNGMIKEKSETIEFADNEYAASPAEAKRYLNGCHPTGVT